MTTKLHHLQVTLTGERKQEWSACRAILQRHGVTANDLTVQRVISAAMQTLIQMDNQGVAINYAFVDGRTAEND